LSGGRALVTKALTLASTSSESLLVFLNRAMSSCGTQSRFLDEILALDQLVAHDSRLRVDVKPTNRIHFPTLRSVLSKRLVGGH
jgi:hypothetical protein